MSLARDSASVTFEVSDVSAAVMISESQFRCLVASCPVGAEVVHDAAHGPTSKLAWNDGSGEAIDPYRNNLFWTPEAPVAEAKKADGASMVALRISRPPFRTGSGSIDLWSGEYFKWLRALHE